MKPRLTKVFYQVRAAINAKNPDGSRKYRYIKLKGSSRSSKTTSLIQNFYTEAWNTDNKRFSVWRDTKKDCKDTVGKDIESIFPGMPYYSPTNVGFHKTESIYTFPSKSVFELCGTDDHVKIHGYNGYGLWLNEPYKISKALFDQLDMRTEGFVVLDMNPLESHWSDDLEKDPRCITLHSTFKDNQFCPIEQKIKILSYQPVSMCEIVESKLLTEFEAKNYDCLNNPKGFTSKQINELLRCKSNEDLRTASAYNWSVYGLGLKAEKPNRIFRWEKIKDDGYHKLDARKYYATDWGVVDPWGVLECKYYDGALYLHELNYASENEIMARLTHSERMQLNAVDEGLVKWYFQTLGVDKKREIACDDNRPMKVLALRDAGFEYAFTAAKGPGSIEEGIDLLGKLKVYYTESSKNLEYEQENYSRVVDRYGEATEEPEDFNNHLIDPARYIAIYLRQEGIIKVI